MGKVSFQITMSVDGFIAGPDQSLEQPLGRGGEALHEWVVPLEAWRKLHGLEGGIVNASTAVLEDGNDNVGAVVMGRNMFGGGPGPWAKNPWQGWWGDDPPFHAPVFVLTNYQRSPLEMQGGTTFNFVTDGFDSALKQARGASGDRNVSIAGGAQTIQQALRSGEVDDFWLHIASISLGAGSRLFEDIPAAEFEQIESVAGEGVTHIKYRVRK